MAEVIWNVGTEPKPGINVEETINQLIPSALVLVGVARTTYEMTGKLNTSGKPLPALPEDLRKEITLNVLQMYTGKVLKER